jgi:flagellar hook-length control protein FliK
MSIELAAPPSPQPKAASAGLGPNGKLKAGAKDRPSVDDSSSFSTLLAASVQGTDDSEPASAQDAVPDGAKEGAPPNALQAPQPALDLAALLALAGQADAGRASAGTVALPSPNAMVTANVVAMSVMAETQTSGPMAHRATVAGGKNGLQTVMPGGATASLLGGPAAGASVKASLPAGKNAVTDPLSVTPDLTDARQLAASVARTAEKLEIHGARLEAFSREPALAGLLAASGLGDGLIRQAGANSDKPSGRLAQGSFEGLGGAMQAPTGASGEVMAPPELVTVQTTDTMLADTVSYWVSQGVQKAELKLDGFGAEPIEVSISLANGEAQIGFRTDRADLREVIEGAMSHLKELLASEGLVLAGVSVGASGQDRAGAQAQRDRAGARHKGVSLVEQDVALAAPRARAVSGRTVDLFV